MQNHLSENSFIRQVVDLLQSARQQVVRTVNQTMVLTYYEMGRMIVEEEQNGKNRAEYGKQLLKGLSDKLTQEFGKGFSLVNIENIRKFYFVYSKSLLQKYPSQIVFAIPQSLTEELNTPNTKSVLPSKEAFISILSLE
jgi:hypothetical protein